MARVVIECSQCGQKLSVPQKTGELDCPKCANTITLKFEPRVVHTPPWFNKTLGFILIFLAFWLWNNTMWLRTNLIDDSGLFEGLANVLCFAGVMVIAFADLVRHRGRLVGEQAYLTPASEGQGHTDGHEHTEAEKSRCADYRTKIGPQFLDRPLGSIVDVACFDIHPRSVQLVRN